MSNTQLTWKEFHLKFAASVNSRNKDSSLILDMSVPEQEQVKSISNLVSNKVSIVCFFSSPTSSMNFIHSTADLEGGILAQSSKVVALNGFGNNGFPVIINNSCISKIVDQQVPKLDALIQMESKEAVNGLALEDVDSEILSTHPFMLVPPFLWKTVMELQDRSPSSLLLATLKGISDYASSDDNVDGITLVNLQSMCTRLLQFLWLSEKSIMTNLFVYPPSDDKEVISWSRFKHEQCINQRQNQTIVTQPTQTPNEPSIEATLLKSSLEQYAKLASSDPKKKSFDKLHAPVRNMILNASSSNNEIMAGAPSEDCTDFFKAPTAGEATEIFLNSMEYKWSCNIQLQPGVILSLYSGKFLRGYVDKPSNFSPFSFPKKSFMETKNSSQEALRLQLKELSGEGLSNSDIQGALNQDICIPKQIDFMRYNIKNMIGASCFFFSEYSLLPRSLKIVFDHIEKNLAIYEALQFHNKYFAAEFLFSIDTRIQLWLNDCKKEQYRDQVDDSLINFSNDLNQVLMRRFSIALPSSIKAQIDGSSSEKKSSQEEVPPKRRKMQENDIDSSRVVNDENCNDWQVSFELYDKHFRHNKHMKSRPKMNGTPMCHRWFSKGYCFNNCANRDSHVSCSKIPSDIKEKYESWKKLVMSGN